MEAVAGAFTLTGDVDADSVLERVAIKAGLSFAFFAAIFAAGAAVARALVPKDKYEAVPANKRVIWGECWSSTAHGLFVGFGAAILALNGTWSTDVIAPYPPMLETLFATTAGYSMFDLVLMVGQGDAVSMWVHHILTLLGTAMMTHYRVASFFPGVFLITEVTTGSANVHWYLKKLNMEHTQAYVANLGVRMLSHVVFRVFIGPYAIIHAFTVHGGPAVFWEAFTALPTPVWVLSTLNVAFLSYMNVVWTTATIAAFRKALRKPKTT